MEEKLLRFAKMLDVKDKLLRLEKEELIEEYREMSKYTLFVEGVLALVEDDIDFFHFSALKEEVFEVFSLYRFDKSLDKSLIAKINKVITAFNSIKDIDDDTEKRDTAMIDYCTKEIIARGFIFTDPVSLLESFTYDIDVFISILDEDLSSFEDERFVLASLNYFGNVFKEMYEDEEIREVVKNYLEMVKKKKGLFRGKIKSYAKDMNKKFFQEAE